MARFRQKTGSLILGIVLFHQNEKGMIPIFANYYMGTI